MMGPVPTKDEEDSREDVDGQYESTDGEEVGGQDPGRGHSMGRIEGLGGPQKCEGPGHDVRKSVTVSTEMQE